MRSKECNFILNPLSRNSVVTCYEIFYERKSLLLEGAVLIVDLNGRIIPAEEAQVSAFDHGLMYGIGLFETFRTYQGRPFLLDEHLQRLQDGCDELGILYDASKAKWL